MGLKSDKKKIVVICGPTGIGKTGFAIDLALRFDGEIVGADSMQIYRYMDIGTAKPDAGERSLARHHLVDVADPDEPFDAAKYQSLADEAISSIIKRDKLPIVTGGTGFYVKALLYGLFRKGAAVLKVLESLQMELNAKGAAFMHNRLKEIDPDSAMRIHPNDTFRILRALEVMETTGKPISIHQENHQFRTSRYHALVIGLTMDRDLLYQRINYRVDQMIGMGLLQEVNDLILKGYPCSLKSMQSIGYRHVCDFLNQKTSWEETIRLMKRDTRRYAKRQFTWFRNQIDMVWLDPENKDSAGDLIRMFLETS